MRQMRREGGFRLPWLNLLLLVLLIFANANADFQLHEICGSYDSQLYQHIPFCSIFFENYAQPINIDRQAVRTKENLHLRYQKIMYTCTKSLSGHGEAKVTKMLQNGNKRQNLEFSRAYCVLQNSG